MESGLRLLPGQDRELRINARSGRIVVRAEERDDVLVEQGAEHLHVSRDEGGALTLNTGRGGSAGIELLCPIGTPLTIGNGSGRVDLSGTFGAVRATTASGGISIERAEAVDLRTNSGNVSVDAVSGFCRVQTRSSRAEIGSCGRLEASTLSGPYRGWAGERQSAHSRGERTRKGRGGRAGRRLHPDDVRLGVGAATDGRATEGLPAIRQWTAPRRVRGGRGLQDRGAIAKREH